MQREGVRSSGGNIPSCLLQSSFSFSQREMKALWFSLSRHLDHASSIVCLLSLAVYNIIYLVVILFFCIIY